jgi:polysaccharide deacetylase family protein (PEP-CTERM system associated)
MIHETPAILTIDVEEWFHAHNYAAQIERGSWEGIERRATGGTERLLDLCERLGIRATWFLLGWQAEHDPALVRRIAAAGHEIGCHSYAHPIVYEMDPEDFRRDTVRARNAIGDAVGYAPVLYRAPSFTITRRSYWALHILREEGFRIDSSIFPVAHTRYGNPRGPREPFLLGGQDGLLVLPMTTLRVAGMNFAFSGGGYFRLFPLWFVQAATNYVQRRQHEPVVYYFHPWELDPWVPDTRLGGLQDLRSQGGKKDLYGKLERALAGRRLVTLGEWAAEVRPRAPRVDSL